jgi:lipopolysaccharide/colanic/teichoic acid biosynthesis glycosyltransferase
MSFFNNLKHFISFSINTTGGIKDKMLSKEAFRRVVERERARVDRYGGGFSLTVFDVGDAGKQKANGFLLAQIVGKRLRPTDEVGWFDKAKVGIVLPNTTPRGARKLSKEICRKIAMTRPAPAFKIYTYPIGGPSAFNKDLQDIFNKKNESYYPTETGKQPTIPKPLNGEMMAESLAPFLGIRMPVWKQAIDISGAAVGLVLLLPLMTVIAILIKIVSPGPVFFKQKRVGYLGRHFIMYKFRTMKVKADTTVHKDYVCKLIKDGKPLAKLDCKDPRIIPFGRFLRLTGLDEIPQLINILKGEMSLIGPRPELPTSMQSGKQWHAIRLYIKPGLSGLWQVSDRTQRTFDEMVRLDISYLKRMSFWLDAWIILKTIPTILSEARR